ncbi:MAG: hypothetical protein HY342_11610 [Candidatus Lambdaproteobacteria bacterium]|nr:hypothetical protein [Candidatus Lambdaproteobacteria bacterium]
MNHPPNSDRLAALRRRFLMEDPSVVCDWLWGEHPQTAAFVLNWIGDLELVALYLSPLPTPQQADVLCRVCYLDVRRPLDALQQELLIEALQHINPRPRAVDESGDTQDDDGEPALGGLPMAYAYLDLLPADEFDELILELEELDRNLARLCHNHCTAVREAEGGPQPHNLYGILNNFCDFIGYKFNRSLGARTVVFVDAVELQSDAAQAREDDQGGSFKVTDEEGRVVVFMRFSPRLLYHYLEMSYGAPRPFFHANFEKPSFTPLEQYVAVAFAGELANALLQVVDASHAEHELVTEFLDGDLLTRELAQLGEETVLRAALTVRMAKSTIGSVQLIFPASQLQATDLDDTHPIGGLASLHQRSERRGGAWGGPHVPTAVFGNENGQDEGEEDGGEQDGQDEDYADGDLENLLFQSALEDAEEVQDKAYAAQPRPLDLLLAGYAPGDIEQLLPERDDELRRMANTHYHYGSILFQRELFPEATEALEQALRCNPDHGHAQLLQAASWGEQGLYLKEILTYKRLVAENRCLPEAFVLLARRLSFLGKINESLDALKKAYKMGFNANEIIETDPCFDPLRKSNRWRQFFNQQS